MKRREKIAVGVMCLLLLFVGQMQGQEQGGPSLPGQEFAPGSPWLDESTRKATRLGALQEEAKTYASKYQKLAYVVRNMDIRKDPMEFRSQWTKQFLSQERPGYRKTDPFNYPTTLPEELLPRRGREPESRQAKLAEVARKTKIGVLDWFTFQGIMVLNKQKYLVVIPTGTRPGFSSMTLKEGDVVPLGVVEVIPPGRLFPTRTVVNGVLQVVVIQERYVVMKVGVYYPAEPTYIVWEMITCYPLTGVSNIYCY
ncbi:MAG: hypothetical protein ACK4G3_05590 [bacterium]